MGAVDIPLAVIITSREDKKKAEGIALAVIHNIKAEQDGSCGHRLSSNS